MPHGTRSRSATTTTTTTPLQASNGSQGVTNAVTEGSPPQTGALSVTNVGELNIFGGNNSFGGSAIGQGMAAAASVDVEDAEGGASKKKLGVHYNNCMKRAHLNEALGSETLEALFSMALDSSDARDFYNRVVDDKVLTANKIYFDRFPFLPQLGVNCNHTYMACIFRSVYGLANPERDEDMAVVLRERFTDKRFYDTMKQRIATLKKFLFSKFGAVAQSVLTELKNGWALDKATGKLTVDATKCCLFPIANGRYEYSPSPEQCAAFGIPNSQNAKFYIHAMILNVLALGTHRFIKDEAASDIGSEIVKGGITLKRFNGVISKGRKAFLLALLVCNETSNFSKVLRALTLYVDEVRTTEKLWSEYRVRKFKLIASEVPMDVDFKRIRTSAQLSSSEDEAGEDEAGEGEDDGTDDEEND